MTGSRVVHNKDVNLYEDISMNRELRGYYRMGLRVGCFAVCIMQSWI